MYSSFTWLTTGNKKVPRFLPMPTTVTVLEAIFLLPTSSRALKFGFGIGMSCSLMSKSDKTTGIFKDCLTYRSVEIKIAVTQKRKIDWRTLVAYETLAFLFMLETD